MNAQSRRPWLVVLAGASALSLGGLFWVSRGLVQRLAERPRERPSLLDLLAEGPRPAPAPARRQVTAPPRSTAWVSPLRQSCPMRDAEEEKIGRAHV